MMRYRVVVAFFLGIAPSGSAAWALDLHSASTGVTYTVVESASGLAYTALRENDTTAERFDLVIMGDGYTETDQDLLTEAANTFARRLIEVPPYSELESCINIWMINLVSKESGIADPDHGWDDRDTALKCSFASGGGMEITGNDALAADLCGLAGVPFDAIFVIVRDKSNHDGATGDHVNAIAYASDKYLWGTVMAHELGHVIGRLADEYRAPFCYQGSGCVSEEPTAVYSDGAPGEIWAPEEPNLTIEADSARVPWADLMQTNAFPTTIDSVVNGNVIGRWEGGDRRCFKVYRPRQSCLMDGVTGENPETDPFCPVCVRAIVDNMRTRFGCPSE